MANLNPIEEVLGALRDHWLDVMERLDEEARVMLMALLRQYSDADPDDRPDIALEVVLHLGDSLPADHPVRRAVVRADSPMRAVGTADPPQVDFDDLFAELQRRMAVVDESAHRVTGVDEVKSRLFAAPSLSPRQVRERGHDPDDPALIRLTPTGGETRLPGFQFDESGAPRPVVLRINAMLGADTDPWGTASWWLEDNARFNEAPSRLLGRMADEDLTTAAAAVIEDGD
ncbi:hypothetical protein BZB76_2534 [Actinomadura pelletieri DSM 43383]|uniref:Uncharacterized protein n=1 Tax=Actinomadura pelletieri DSM 43383 TaxID=1120940 RepID=A0A495QUI9_9ACTN|nr:hypothetical protein [Actinomadura pelletieri]RKS77159.1 hypothetical protein BZB76_2534 [Actinomadura pelletieri DSM 43383]